MRCFECKCWLLDGEVDLCNGCQHHRSKVADMFVWAGCFAVVVAIIVGML